MKTSEEKNTYIQSALDVLEGEGRVFTKQKSQVYGVMEYYYICVLLVWNWKFYRWNFIRQRFKEILDRTLIS